MTTRQVAFRLKSDGKAELKRDFAEVGQAGAQAYGQVERAANEAGQASDRQMAKYRQMAEAARQAGRAADEQRKINALLGVDRGGVKSARDSADAFLNAPGASRRGLTANQRNTLIYTVSDIFASGASGASPAMIAMQQGPQVLQAWAVEGGKATASMLKFGAAIGLPVAAIGLLTGAFLANREAGRQLEISVSGIGAASGVTAEGLYALAEANRDAGDISGSAARGLAATYAETGRIGEEVIGRLIAASRSYATVTRQDLQGASRELAQAFSDPAKGAEVLNAKLGLLDDGTYRYIQTLLEQNRVTDAQLVLSDALSRRLLTAADNTTVLGRAWDAVKNSALGAWDAIGRAIDRAAGGGTAMQRIQDLTNERAIQAQVPFGLGNARVREIDAELAKIREGQLSQERAAAQARANQIAADARAAQDRVNPRAGRLRELRRDEARISQALEAGVLSDPEAARKDLANLRKEIAAVEAGYASASAQASALGSASRKAATEARRSAREAEREAELIARNAERLADLQLRDRLNLAKLQDNKALVEDLEHESRLRRLINDYESAGVASAKARLMAQAQITAEVRAEVAARTRELTETPADFVSTEETLARWNAMKIEANDNAEAAAAMKDAYMSAFDRIGDRLAAGGLAWGTWRDTARAAIQDIIGEMIRLAAINPLKNALFGTSAPTLGSGGLLGAIFGGGGSGLMAGNKSVGQRIMESKFPFGLIPGFASGTNYAPGGLAYVHRDELIDLPRGSRVIPSHAVRAIGAMSGGGGGVTVSVPISIDARGAGPREVDALRGELAELKQSLPGTIVETVSDAQARRWLRAG